MSLCSRPVLCLLTLFVAAASAAPTVEIPAAKVGPSLELALQAAEAARAACAAHQVSVAVVDAAGELKVLLAADGSRPIFADLAWRKARTAALFQMSTADAAAKSRTDAGMFWRLSSSNFSYYGGGLPIISRAGAVVGGLAVSGAANEQGDAACAQAGIARLTGKIE